jgi:nitrogen-specific signal transduction histidine kinase
MSMLLHLFKNEMRGAFQCLEESLNPLRLKSFAHVTIKEENSILKLLNMRGA